MSALRVFYLVEAAHGADRSGAEVNVSRLILRSISRGYPRHSDQYFGGECFPFAVQEPSCLSIPLSLVIISLLAL